MALWRDPLDELIEDLERRLPPEPQKRSQSYAEFQFEVDAWLKTADEERIRGPSTAGQTGGSTLPDQGE